MLEYSNIALGNKNIYYLIRSVQKIYIEYKNLFFFKINFVIHKKTYAKDIQNKHSYIGNSNVVIIGSMTHFTK